ncbi:hypothetical protein C2G38_2072654, partial [Gigaspora rosea]
MNCRGESTEIVRVVAADIAADGVTVSAGLFVKIICDFSESVSPKNAVIFFTTKKFYLHLKGSSVLVDARVVGLSLTFVPLIILLVFEAILFAFENTRISSLLNISLISLGGLASMLRHCSTRLSKNMLFAIAPENVM